MTEINIPVVVTVLLIAAAALIIWAVSYTFKILKKDSKVEQVANQVVLMEKIQQLKKGTTVFLIEDTPMRGDRANELACRAMHTHPYQITMEVLNPNAHGVGNKIKVTVN